MSLNLFAQKEIKEGVIMNKVTMSSENEQVNASLAMIGDMNTTTYFKGNKSRTEMKSPMTGDNTTIIDNDAKKMFSLISNPMLGNKYTRSDIKASEDELKNLVVTKKGDSKTILGYLCKGYDITGTTSGIEVKMTMYITNKIIATTQNNAILGAKLKGYPMYLVMDVNQGQMIMQITMEATEVKDEKVADSKFDMIIPEGYTEMEIPKPPKID
jgi:hypothetical protein